MLWLVAIFLPLFLVSGWLYTVNVSRTGFPKIRNKKICLLIAHPDDEAMFFAPTLLALTESGLGNHVKILCLSTGKNAIDKVWRTQAKPVCAAGDADGLGETRKKELVKSGMLLGLRNADDVFIVDNKTDFPDSMTATWPKEKISSLLSSAFAPNLSNTLNSKSAEAPTATIDILITFDAIGVSSHPNHISLYNGARQFISSLIANRPGWQCPVDLYTLTSVNIVRKYSSFLDAMCSLGVAASGATSKEPHLSPLLFLSGLSGVRTAQLAMTTAHVSQMRWFRWGWIGLSRYMVINDLKLEKVP